MGATLRKPHSSAPHPMQRLAAVEVHLICHGLECADLIRFARCSKELFRLCAEPHAWHYTLLDVFARRCMGAVQPNRPFALDVPVSLMLDSSYPPPRDDDNPDPAPSALEQIVTSGRLVKLRACSSKRISSASWIALMSLPHFGSNLRILDLRFSLLPINPSEPFLGVLVTLPKLTTILFGDVGLDLDLAAAPIAMLAQCPALTSIDLRKIGNAMEGLAQCAKLRRLTVSMPNPLSLSRYCEAALRNSQPLETLSLDFHFTSLTFDELLPKQSREEALVDMGHMSVNRRKLRSAGRLQRLFGLPALRTLRLLNVSAPEVLAKSFEAPSASTALPFQLVVNLSSSLPSLVEIRRGRTMGEGERGSFKVIRNRETELRMAM